MVQQGAKGVRRPRVFKAQLVKTKVVKKTLDPVWDQRMDFIVASQEKPGTICVVIKDQDMMSSEFMGQLEFKIADVPITDKNNTIDCVEGWYPLCDKDMNIDAARGELQLSVRCWLERVNANKWFADQGGGGSSAAARKRMMLQAANADPDETRATESKVKVKNLWKKAGKRVNAANAMRGRRVSKEDRLAEVASNGRAFYDRSKGADKRRKMEAERSKRLDRPDLVLQQRFIWTKDMEEELKYIQFKLRGGTVKKEEPETAKLGWGVKEPDAIEQERRKSIVDVGPTGTGQSGVVKQIDPEEFKKKLRDWKVDMYDDSQWDVFGDKTEALQKARRVEMKQASRKLLEEAQGKKVDKYSDVPEPVTRPGDVAKSIFRLKQGLYRGGKASWFNSTIGDIGAAEPGLSLYLLFLRSLSLYFICAFVLSMPVLAMYSNGKGLPGDMNDILGIGSFSFANLGLHQANADSMYCKEHPKVCAGAATPGTRTDPSTEEALMMISSLDWYCTVLFVLVTMFLDEQIRRHERYRNHSMPPCPSKYTVFVQGLPPDITAMRLRNFLHRRYNMLEGHATWPMNFGCFGAKSLNTPSTGSGAVNDAKRVVIAGKKRNFKDLQTPKDKDLFWKVQDEKGSTCYRPMTDMRHLKGTDAMRQDWKHSWVVDVQLAYANGDYIKTQLWYTKIRQRFDFLKSLAEEFTSLESLKQMRVKQCKWSVQQCERKLKHEAAAAHKAEKDKKRQMMSQQNFIDLEGSNVQPKCMGRYMFAYAEEYPPPRPSTKDGKRPKTPNVNEAGTEKRAVYAKEGIEKEDHTYYLFFKQGALGKGVDAWIVMRARGDEKVVPGEVLGRVDWQAVDPVKDKHVLLRSFDSADVPNEEQKWQSKDTSQKPHRWSPDKSTFAMEIDWKEAMKEEEALMLEMAAASKKGKSVKLSRKSSTAMLLAQQAMYETKTELERLKAEEARLEKHGGAAHADIDAIFGMPPSDGLFTIKEKLQGLKDQKRTVEVKLSHMRRLDTTCVGAFVTFNNRVTRDWCLDDYRFSQHWLCRFLQPYPLRLCTEDGTAFPLKITAASAPQSVLWENLADESEPLTYLKRSARRMLSFSLLVGIWIGTAHFLYSIPQKASAVLWDSVGEGGDEDICRQLPANFFGTHHVPIGVPIVRMPEHDHVCEGPLAKSKYWEAAAPPEDDDYYKAKQYFFSYEGANFSSPLEYAAPMPPMSKTTKQMPAHPNASIIYYPYVLQETARTPRLCVESAATTIAGMCASAEDAVAHAVSVSADKSHGQGDVAASQGGRDDVCMTLPCMVPEWETEKQRCRPFHRQVVVLCYCKQQLREAIRLKGVFAGIAHIQSGGDSPDDGTAAMCEEYAKLYVDARLMLLLGATAVLCVACMLTWLIPMVISFIKPPSKEINELWLARGLFMTQFACLAFLFLLTGAYMPAIQPTGIAPGSKPGIDWDKDADEAIVERTLTGTISRLLHSVGGKMRTDGEDRAHLHPLYERVDPLARPVRLPVIGELLSEILPIIGLMDGPHIDFSRTWFSSVGSSLCMIMLAAAVLLPHLRPVLLLLRWKVKMFAMTVTGNTKMEEESSAADKAAAATAAAVAIAAGGKKGKLKKKKEKKQSNAGRRRAPLVAQRDLDLAVQPPQQVAQLGAKYPTYMALLFAGFTFSGGMPILLPVLGVAMGIGYMLDKYVVLRARQHRNHRLQPKSKWAKEMSDSNETCSLDADMSLAKWVTGLLPWAMVVHLCVSIWMLSSADIVTDDGAQLQIHLTGVSGTLSGTSMGRGIAPSSYVLLEPIRGSFLDEKGAGNAFNADRLAMLESRLPPPQHTFFHDSTWALQQDLTMQALTRRVNMPHTAPLTTLLAAILLYLIVLRSYPSGIFWVTLRQIVCIVSFGYVASTHHLPIGLTGDDSFDARAKARRDRKNPKIRPDADDDDEGGPRREKRFAAKQERTLDVERVPAWSAYTAVFQLSLAKAERVCDPALLYVETVQGHLLQLLLPVPVANFVLTRAQRLWKWWCDALYDYDRYPQIARLNSIYEALKRTFTSIYKLNIKPVLDTKVGQKLVKFGHLCWWFGTEMVLPEVVGHEIRAGLGGDRELARSDGRVSREDEPKAGDKKGQKASKTKLSKKELAKQKRLDKAKQKENPVNPVVVRRGVPKTKMWDGKPLERGWEISLSEKKVAQNEQFIARGMSTVVSVHDTLFSKRLDRGLVGQGVLKETGEVSFAPRIHTGVGYKGSSEYTRPSAKEAYPKAEFGTLLPTWKVMEKIGPYCYDVMRHPYYREALRTTPLFKLQNKMWNKDDEQMEAEKRGFASEMWGKKYMGATGAFPYALCKQVALDTVKALTARPPEYHRFVAIDGSDGGFEYGKPEAIIEEMHAPKESQSFLRVTVIQAVDLLAMDSSGTSDPYVKLSTEPFNFKTWKTVVKKKTLAPFWNHQFELEVSGITTRGVLKLDFFDYDVVGSDDLLGQVKVPLYTMAGRMEGGKAFQEWYDLDMTVKKQKVAAGKVQLRLQLLHGPKSTPVIESIGEPGEGKMHIRVGIMEGKGLRSMDSNGLSDPYAILKICGKECRTPVRYKSLDPFWDHTFEFDITEKVTSHFLRMVIMDRDPGPDPDDFMGQLKLPLSSMYALNLDGKSCRELDEWYALTDKKGKHEGMGMVRLKVQVIKGYEPEHELTHMERVNLTFKDPDYLEREEENRVNKVREKAARKAAVAAAEKSLIVGAISEQREAQREEKEREERRARAKELREKDQKRFQAEIQAEANGTELIRENETRAQAIAREAKKQHMAVTFKLENMPF